MADSGSTDGTLEYLRARGDCRVIEREYRTAGDFKNWAIPQAAHRWVLVARRRRAGHARAGAGDSRAARRRAEARRLLDPPRQSPDGPPRALHRLGPRSGAAAVSPRGGPRTPGPATTATVQVRPAMSGRSRRRWTTTRIWSWEQYLQEVRPLHARAGGAVARRGPAAELAADAVAAAAAVLSRLRAAPRLPRRRRGPADRVDERVLHAS